jgi:hypothetical protein
MIEYVGVVEGVVEGVAVLQLCTQVAQSGSSKQCAPDDAVMHS